MIVQRAAHKRRQLPAGIRVVQTIRGENDAVLMRIRPPPIQRVRGDLLHHAVPPRILLHQGDGAGLAIGRHDLQRRIG